MTSRRAFQVAAVAVTAIATVALLVWRREHPIEGWQSRLESYGVAIVWVAVLIGSGIWRGRQVVAAEPVTYFNSAWNPEAVDRAGHFLAWLVAGGLLSEKWSADPSAKAFRRGDLTGPELLENWGEKIVSEMLDETGNAFTLDYFAASDEYWDDCDRILGRSGEEAEHDTQPAVDQLPRRIDLRFSEWRSRRSSPTSGEVAS